MNDQHFVELMDAVVDLRNATEMGFHNVDRRFDEMDLRLERWERRFNALETRLRTAFVRFQAR
jgi:hypothetical protein